MNADSTICLNCSRFRKQLLVGLRLQLALACLMSLVTQPLIAASLIAEDGRDNEATAAFPEPGSPPSPAEPRVAEVAEVAKDDTTVTTHENVNEGLSSTSGDSNSKSAVDDKAEAGRSIAGESAGDPSGFVRGDAEPVAEVRELSVQPEAKPLLPADRPGWVGASPDLSTSTHRLFVGSYPTASPEEADQALDEPLLAAVIGYVDETVLDDNGARRIEFTADYIRKNLIDESMVYMAELSTSQGPLYQKWVVLRITPEHRKHFRELHRQLEQQKRLVRLGAGLLGVLGLTGVTNFAFNRRRRRYGSTLPPGTYAFLHEEAQAVPEVPKHRRKVSLPLAFGLIAAMSMASLVVLRKARMHIPHHAPHVVHTPHVRVPHHTRLNTFPEPMRLNDLGVMEVPLR